MPHYYLFKFKKNDMVFEFSSQDPKVMYSQFNKWVNELVNSNTKKINIDTKTLKEQKNQESISNKKSEPLIIEKVKIVTQAEYDAMQMNKPEEAPVIDSEPLMKDFPDESQSAIIDQPAQSVKLASMNLEDIDKSTRDESITQTPVKQPNADEYDFITFETIDKPAQEQVDKPSNDQNNVIDNVETVTEKSKFKRSELSDVKEYKSYEFPTMEKSTDLNEENIIAEKIAENSVIKEKFNPSNSNEVDNSKDQFFKILQKKFSSIAEETPKQELEEIVTAKINKIEEPKILHPSDQTTQEFEKYTIPEEVKNINPAVVSGKALDLKNIDNLIELKKPNNMFDYLIIAAYYLKESEYLDRYSLKQINAKIFPYTKKPIDHSVIQKAVARNYVEVVPDYTGMAEVTEYVITDEGENYLLNEI